MLLFIFSSHLIAFLDLYIANFHLSMSINIIGR
jgi:hypothetical protein